MRRFSSIIQHEIITKGGNVILAGQEPADVIADLEKMYAVEKPFADLRGAEYLNDADQVRLLKIEAELPELFTRLLDALKMLLHYHLLSLYAYWPKERGGCRGRAKRKFAINRLDAAFVRVEYTKAASLPAGRFNECFITVDAVVNTYHYWQGTFRPLFGIIRQMPRGLPARSADDAWREVWVWLQTRRKGITLTGNKQGVCAI